MDDIIEVGFNKKRKISDSVKVKLETPTTPSIPSMPKVKESPGPYMFPCTNAGRDNYEKAIRSRDTQLTRAGNREKVLAKENEALKQQILMSNDDNAVLKNEIARLQTEVAAHKSAMMEMGKTMEREHERIHLLKLVENCVRTLNDVLKMEV
ncbi:hypothetical protein K461DRAFT_139571 [Myriangium duriaei CBS 260.36]|uniref:Uncharacterized protein n=1 Tax=Myriangium duriaei CBS 260.36 TaxID=1168546 RepID=A0A9P4MHP2_9PEZI|nr:hypothetical protein K461DRAFT_139571 [Myriangium duriaei CBS 260.36]